ncbi:MAG: alpha-D-glucose phosphate-specific phosphoglucomutase [Verrucomicrobiales bacterium]|nr:alpha-D-glucose phosphate-specific phosphoglucomutase [Verrucomicrobiales bacterium]
MSLHERAGKLPTRAMLIDPDRLARDFEKRSPEPLADGKQVSFGTSGHRGSPFAGTFTRAHILAVTQAICDVRRRAGITGPLFLAKDTHGASVYAEQAALEVLAANGVQTLTQTGGGFTPTPAVSRAILRYNRGRQTGLADGLILTPSHNPPQDGGIKYNPPNGGPAETDVTRAIEQRANALLKGDNREVKRIPYSRATRADSTHAFDYVTPYLEDLDLALNLEAIRAAGIKLGVDPLGGASLAYWDPLAERYGLDLTVLNRKVDPTFRFMTLDHDGVIRMDCSSKYAMAGLVRMKDRFDIAWGCDPDADRHGIVTPFAGLLNPNHFLSVAVDYLVTHRPNWPAAAAIGKTLVSSSLLDKVAAAQRRKLCEVPVGFKWFVPGLFSGTLCFGGEESAGASFLARNGTVWTTDKDGLLLGLLAAEITAVTRHEPGYYYHQLTRRHGATFYKRVDEPLDPDQTPRFQKLTAQHVAATQLAGDRIRQKLTHAPGNDAPLGGLKVVTDRGWFAARPSGTEPKFKLYAESLVGADHLDALLTDARRIIQDSLAAVTARA